MKGTMAKLIHIQTSPRGSRSASQSVATGFVGFSDIREIFVEPTTIPISAWSGKFSLFRRCCTSLTEVSAPESLGLPARKGKVMNRFSNRTVIANPSQGFNQFRTVFRTFKFLTPHNCSLQTSSDVSHEPVTQYASHLARALPKGF